MASDDKSRRRPTTQVGRLMRMGRMTTSIAGRVARHQVRGMFQSVEERRRGRDALMGEIGREVAATLGEMKGAVMKVGQIASQMQDILPREIAEALSVLQKSSPPMPYATIRRQIRRELGAEPQALFERFDEQPFAAASIGQVHRARMADGREVVVKVQYPAVKESIDSDMRQLRRVLRLGGLLKVEPQALDAIFAEIRDQLNEELDYQREAEHLRRFRAFHDEPWLVIPEVVGERSTGKVLTLTLEAGDDLETVRDSPAYDQATRNLIGERLFDAIGRQIFELGAVHCDPHPGNFAFRPDGTLVMYDFGAVKRVPAEDAAAFRAVMRAAIERDFAALEEGLMALEIRKNNATVVANEFYAGWLDLLLPVFGEEPFDFGRSRLHLHVAKKTGTTPWKYLESFQPSARVLQMDRLLGGHYWTLVKLGVNTAFRPQLDAYLREP